MIVHEQRHTYDAARDPVATMTLTVECAPTQVQAVRELLIGTLAGQSLYSVDISDHTVAVPESVAPQPTVAVTDTAAPVDEVAAAPSAGNQEPTGEEHGEQAVLAEHLDTEAAVDGEGSPAEESGAEAPGPLAGEDSGVAWTAGSGAEAGPLAGSA